MEWLWAVLLPFVVCGVMCLGGMALAAVGLRRGRDRSSRRCHGGATSDHVTEDRVDA